MKILKALLVLHSFYLKKRESRAQRILPTSGAAMCYGWIPPLAVRTILRFSKPILGSVFSTLVQFK